MNIIVLTKNPDTYYFGDNLLKHGYSPILCPDFESVLDYIKYEGLSLLLCDFKIFGMESRNPYATLRQKFHPYNVPFIFYNDPFPDFRSGEYLKQWRGTLLEFYGEVDFETDEFLKCLSVAVLDIGAKDEDESEKSSINESDFDRLKSFLDIPKSKFDMLKIFYENIGQVVSAQELSQKIWGIYDSHSVSNVYAYITYLRKKFDENPRLGMSILNVGKGEYVFDMDLSCLNNL